MTEINYTNLFRRLPPEKVGSGYLEVGEFNGDSYQLECQVVFYLSLDNLVSAMVGTVEDLPDVSESPSENYRRIQDDGSAKCVDAVPSPEGEGMAPSLAPDPAELAQEILESLGGSPCEVVYSLNRQDVAVSLAQKLLEGEADLDALFYADLESLFQAGVEGAGEIDWQSPIHFRLDQVRAERFSAGPKTHRPL